MTILPFNLELAIKYPNNIYTKKGDRVNIISFNSTDKPWGEVYPIRATVNGIEHVYTLNGSINLNYKDDRDLEIRMELIDLVPDLWIGDKICICGIDYIIVGEFFDSSEEYFVVREKAVKTKKYSLLHKNTKLSIFEFIY